MKRLLLPLVLAAGCVPARPLYRLSSDHPACPSAASSAFERPDPSLGTASEPAPGGEDSGGAGASPHSGHGQHRGMGHAHGGH